MSLLLAASSLATVPENAAQAATPARSGPTSIVQLGDSIASGEGTLYGFTFDPSTGKWQGPSNADPAWLGPYPDCHQSGDAYGQLVAATYPKAKFTQLACTGATFAQGIAGPWSQAVPPEFGDWASRTGLNPRYSRANPDLVLVTLGADDVRFTDIVTQCAEYYYHHPFSAVQCTKGTPTGPDDVITKDFTDEVPVLEQNLRTLAGWIEERGRQLGSGHGPPKIVFTTYPDPLPADPPPGQDNFCPDTWLFYNDQLTYFSSLVRQLDTDIVATIDQYAAEHKDQNIAVVDLYGADDGHRWCAKDTSGSYTDPWAYGFSIYPHYSDLNDPNPAAFHPTPQGQKAIAARVEAAIARLYRG